jgi:Transposase IS66 family
MAPVECITDFFEHQVGLPLSAGTVVNINSKPAAALTEFEITAKNELLAELVLHADERGSVHEARVFVATEQLFVVVPVPRCP